jgi:two-component sensor histidine kinase
VVGEAARIINHRIDKAVRLAVMSFAAQQALIRKEQEDEHLAFVAHDLRTPLNAVSLLVEVLRRGLNQMALNDAGDLFELLRRNLQRVEALIKRVLATRVQPSALGSSFRPECRTFELWPLVQRLILDLGAVSSKHTIEVVNDVPPALSVFAVAGLVSQVFQNLLGNAFKYAARGRVIVSASVNEVGNATCVVRDNGAGIPLELLAKVFDQLGHGPGQRRHWAGIGDRQADRRSPWRHGGGREYPWSRRGVYFHHSDGAAGRLNIDYRRNPHPPVGLQIGRALRARGARKGTFTPARTSQQNQLPPRRRLVEWGCPGSQQKEKAVWQPEFAPGQTVTTLDSSSGFAGKQR